MTIHLTEGHERLIHSLVEGGRYLSESDVIEEALRVLEDHDDQARLAELRHEIAIGREQADRGELAPFDPIVTLARVRSRKSDAGQV